MKKVQKKSFFIVEKNSKIAKVPSFPPPPLGEDVLADGDGGKVEVGDGDPLHGAHGRVPPPVAEVHCEINPSMTKTHKLTRP